MSITKKIGLVINTLIKRSTWYKEQIFPDCQKFINHNTTNLDIINLGSTSAKYAFDYTEFPLKAANWAMAPQSFVHDYAILTNYCSYLKEGTHVLISICPFSSLGGGNDYFSDKYYTIVRPISIPNFSLCKRDEIKKIYNMPLYYFPVFSLFSRRSRSRGIMSSNCMKIDADKRIENWLKEFSINRLSDELGILNRDRFADSVLAIKKIIDFCISHGYIPTIVLPPMSKYLSMKFTPEDRKKYIYNFIESVSDINIKFLNFLDNSEFSDDSLYLDSYLLNNKGAKVFTKRLLEQIRLI